MSYHTILLSDNKKVKTISFNRDNLKITIFQNKIIIGTNLLTPISIFYIYKKYKIIPGHVLTDEKLNYYINKAKESISKLNEFIYENYKFIENYSIYRYLIMLLSADHIINQKTHLFHNRINTNELKTLKYIKQLTETIEYNNLAYMGTDDKSNQILKLLIYNKKFKNYIELFNNSNSYTGVFKNTKNCNSTIFNKSTFNLISDKIYASENVVARLNNLWNTVDYGFYALNLWEDKITSKNRHQYNAMEVFPLKGLVNSFAVKTITNSLKFYIPSYVSILNINKSLNYYANDNESSIDIKEALFNFELFNGTKLRNIIPNLNYEEIEIVRFDEVLIIGEAKYYSSFSHYKKRFSSKSHSIKTILHITPYFKLVSNTPIDNASFEIKDLIADNIIKINKFKTLMNNFSIPEFESFQDFIDKTMNFKKSKNNAYYINVNKYELIKKAINNYKFNYPNKKEIELLYNRHLFELKTENRINVIDLLINDKLLKKHFKLVFKHTKNYNSYSNTMTLLDISKNVNKLLILNRFDEKLIIDLNSRINEITLSTI